MATTNPAAPPMGPAEVLHTVESWPPEQVLALTLKLAGSLPPEAKAAVASELLQKNGTEPDEAPRPAMADRCGNPNSPEGTPADPEPSRPSGDLRSLYGVLKHVGPPLSDADIDTIREMRLREKYGPW